MIGNQYEESILDIFGKDDCLVDRDSLFNVEPYIKSSTNNLMDIEG